MKFKRGVRREKVANMGIIFPTANAAAGIQHTGFVSYTSVKSVLQHNTMVFTNKRTIVFASGCLIIIIYLHMKYVLINRF